jgi:hypothetical protein
MRLFYCVRTLSLAREEVYQHYAYATGQSRVSGVIPNMSAKGSKADIWERAGQVAEVP